MCKSWYNTRKIAKTGQQAAGSLPVVLSVPRRRKRCNIHRKLFLFTKTLVQFKSLKFYK